MGKTPVIDCHCDTILKELIFQDFCSGDKFHITPQKLRKSGINCQVFAVFINPPMDKAPYYFALDMISRIYKYIHRNDDFILVESVSDIDKAINSCKIGIAISLEGAEPLGDNPDFVEIYKKLGVRLITLTWNRRNYFADGLNFHGENDYGLSEHGKQLVKKMEEHGVVCDVAHLNTKGFYQVAEISNAPFISSHSNCRALCSHPRNLDDDQIKIIAQKNGVIGMNFSAEFLNNDKYQASIDDVVRHIDYICNLVGDQYVGLGSDFDGIAKIPIGLEDVSKVPKIKYLLAEKGYSNKSIDRIMGGNFYRLFKEVWK